MPVRRLALARSVAAAVAASFSLANGARAQAPKEIRVDFATCNPVSLVPKERGLLEKALAPDGISVRRVQSLGSNEAREFLDAGSIDFGSTSGAAALIARVGGNPIKSVHAYSRPEWTALVTREGTGIARADDLKGRRVAVTRAFVTRPRVLLLDEPFSALDAFGRADLRAQLLGFWAESRPTILMVAHDVGEAVALAGRVVVLRPKPGRVEEEIDLGPARPRDPASPAVEAAGNRW